MINQSEGEKARRINEAEGRAAEIVSVAKATADGIRKLAGALTLQGGMEAIRLRLSQKYIQNLGNLAPPYDPDAGRLVAVATKP